MCRFAILSASEPRDPRPLLTAFADMARTSRTFDDDWQGDGWGVAWKDHIGNWKSYHSLLPIWENTDAFSSIPATTHLAMHARSASFDHHKGQLSHNQPYRTHQSCFVFNGLLRQVRLPARLEGSIGAQKIWSLLQRFLNKYPPQIALEKTALVLKNASAQIHAANIGLIHDDSLYALNLYSRNPEYYALRTVNTPELRIIASATFGDYPFLPPQSQEIVVL